MKFNILILTALFLSSGAHAQQPVERGSVYSVLINHAAGRFSEDIAETFLQLPSPAEYNDHNLSVRIVNVSDKTLGEGAQQVVDAWVNNNQVGGRLVARWFNHNSETGVCNFDLLRSRSAFSDSKWKRVFSSETNLSQSILEDAGEHLIGKTFLLVHDVMQVDRQRGNRAASTAVDVLNALAGAATGNGSKTAAYARLEQTEANQLPKLKKFYKGFRLHVRTYLYQLQWDDQVADAFYNDCWSDTPDKEKARNFNAFRSRVSMKLVGQNYYETPATSYAGIDPNQPRDIVRKALQRAIDENIVALQQTCFDFRPCTPINVADDGTITIAIGRREGVKETTQFEVLEPYIDDRGHHALRRIATLKPRKGCVWDNRYLALEEEADASTLGATTLLYETGEQNLTSGLLVRQIP